MDDAPLPSETTLRRSKRIRAQTRSRGDEPRKVTDNNDENQEGNSDASNGSLNQVEREGSQDDFEEIRRKSKRHRASEAASGATYTPDARLIEVIRGGGKGIPQAVKRWVEQYEKDPKPAMFELLSMLFEACGAKYYLKEECLDEIDVDNVVAALVDLAKNGHVEDPLSSKKEFKSFKDNLLSFWDNLVIECQNGPLFDKFLFKKCMDYIIAFSCTPPRVYRQVASLIGLQLVTSFISVAKMLDAHQDLSQRQLNAQKKKRTDGHRLDSLNKRLSLTHKRTIALKKMMLKIFTRLFEHRYRDIDPTIRMTCIQSLGVWILSYPTLFLKDSYLKYLGWTLNDKNAGVRKASILALQNLYEVDSNVHTLSLFTEKFLSQMIELAYIDVSAVGLVKQFLRHRIITEEPEDIGPLYDLLVDGPPEIRHAIGELLYDHLIAQKFNSSQSGSKGNGSEVHLSRMLLILREYSAHPILSIYVIDDVWEYMKAMKDWKCIISMLLDETPKELTEDDATNLIRLLLASIRKAVGERIVPASDYQKQYHTKAQKEIFENNRRDITVAIMKNYPLLLHKFMADKAKVSSLVEIIMHVNLELYSLKRQDQNFKAVLHLIKDAFFKHGEKDALRSCVKAITFCCTRSQGELQNFASSQLKDLEDELITKLKSAIKEVMNGEDEYSLLVNLKRLYELQLSRPVSIETLYVDIVSILRSLKNLDGQVISFLLLNMYLHVAWSLHSIIKSETVMEASLSSLLSKCDTLLEELDYFLNTLPEVRDESQTRNQLACRVCTILADIWSLFRKTNFVSTKLERLGYCPDSSVLQKFWRLCEQQLNMSDETGDDEMNKEYVEDTNKVAVMIAAAKLIANDTVPKEYLAPEIISQFVMHGTSVADIIKHLIMVLRKKDEDVSEIFLEALKRAYHRYPVEDSTSDDESFEGKSLQECKDLAARLSGMFADAALNKHRLDILRIVKEGIEYAFVDPPKQLSFLESAVFQFASKLPSTDVQEILTDVQKRTENVNTDEDPRGWRPYFTFYDSLQEKYA